MAFSRLSNAREGLGQGQAETPLHFLSFWMWLCSAQEDSFHKIEGAWVGNYFSFTVKHSTCGNLGE